MNKTDMVKEIAKRIKEGAKYDVKLSNLVLKYYLGNLKNIKKGDLYDELAIATLEMENSRENYENTKLFIKEEKEE